MSDLGVIASKGLLTKRAATPNPPWRLYAALADRSKVIIDVGPRWMFRCLMLGANYQCRGGKDDAEGYPAPSSLRIESRGKWRFRWKLKTGTRTIQVRVKQDNFPLRPSLTVKANPEIGINADLVATALPENDWIIIGPITVTPTSDGATWVEFSARHDAQSVVSYWDFLERT